MKQQIFKYHIQVDMYSISCLSFHIFTHLLCDWENLYKITDINLHCNAN